jgi:SAM-dependent methyltransferase
MCDRWESFQLGPNPSPALQQVMKKEMYYQLAHLYDWPGSLDFCQKILERDLEILQNLKLSSPARIVDLACGTGTLSLALAQQGHEVIGIDLSADMLTQAKSKQQTSEQNGHPLSIQWMEGDMRYFLLDTPADAVVCHYDSLNHLSNETELRGTFVQVAQALRSGGIFLFDLNTLENYRTFWQGKDTYEGPNYRLKTNSSFNEDLNKAEVQFKVEEYNDEGELNFYEEQVFEHYFNETAVEKYLMAADFYDIQWAPFNPVDEIPADFPLKTFWQCRRR